MITPKFKAKVENGKIVFFNRTMFDTTIKRFEGKNICVSVGLQRSNRSINQNAYYWGVVIQILSEETGYEAEEMHEYIADKFLGFDKVVLDKEIRIVPTTTKLTTVEFEEYLSKIRMWASKELGCYVPEPNEVSYKGE